MIEARRDGREPIVVTHQNRRFQHPRYRRPQLFQGPSDRMLDHILDGVHSVGRKGREMEDGFTPWRDVFATLREVRVWRPTDRVQEGDREILVEEIAYMNEGELLPIEIELIFRSSDELALAGEAAVIEAIDSAGGHLVSRCRIADIAYHALLAELPVEALRFVIERSAAGISGMDPIMHIRPQSVASTMETEDATQPPQAGEFAAVEGSPILALLDGVPVSEHPLLRGRLVVDDQFKLEINAIVSGRTHGTAMASLIAHGDRNSSEPTLPRKLHCVPVLGPAISFLRTASLSI